MHSPKQLPAESQRKILVSGCCFKVNTTTPRITPVNKNDIVKSLSCQNLISCRFCSRSVVKTLPLSSSLSLSVGSFCHFGRPFVNAGSWPQERYTTPNQ